MSEKKDFMTELAKSAKITVFFNLRQEQASSRGQNS